MTDKASKFGKGKANVEAKTAVNLVEQFMDHGLDLRMESGKFGPDGR